MESSPEVWRLIKMPGEVVEVGDPTPLYDTPLSTEDEQEFQRAVDAIHEAEQQAWIELPKFFFASDILTTLLVCNNVTLSWQVTI